MGFSCSLIMDYAHNLTDNFVYTFQLLSYIDQLKKHYANIFHDCFKRRTYCYKLPPIGCRDSTNLFHTFSSNNVANVMCGCDSSFI